MDRRLQGRYVKMVQDHARVAGPLAAGAGGSLSATQASWRFLNNPRVTLEALAEPLLEAGRRALSEDGASVGLLVHDWSKLDYRSHRSKADVAQLTHETDVGYELSTALLVGASDGSPLAPMGMWLKTAEGVYGTEPTAEQSHVDQVLLTMEASSGWALENPLVHIVDREADSVFHYRQWDQGGYQFLVRADDRRVRWEGRSRLLSEVVQVLEDRQAFTRSRQVEHHGKQAWQWTAQTTVTLYRPGKRRVSGRDAGGSSGGGARESVPGRPLELRLVVSHVRDAEGGLLATWLLLTNVNESTADASAVALWYYWRWRIESFFKLLKSHGQQIEQWQQHTGQAIARRLLVAAMACVVVWQLQRQDTPQAAQTRQLLVRLSRRQMKHGVLDTAPALLAGLMVLLPILDLMEEHGGDLTTLLATAAQALPLLRAGERRDV